MKCAWQAYLRLLPHWMREQVDKQGKDNLQELRLRIDKPPELVQGNGSQYLERIVLAEDLKYCVNAASQYSPWASGTIKSGYITAQGGHRIGICGEAAIVNGKMSTVTGITSLCIRVARDFPGIALKAVGIQGATLVIGCPGSGKTTLLRDLARQIANIETGAVAVVDERGELFPVVDNRFCFSTGNRLDVMSGCNKASGIEMMIRTMNPRWVVMDEITSPEDCQALLHAGWCGVTVLASAHAESIEDLLTRPVYKPIIQCGLFDNILVMQPDKSWVWERINKCI